MTQRRPLALFIGSIFVVAISSVAFLSAIPTHPATALDQPLTAAQVDKIKNTCIGTQSILNRLHANDALTRVNRGQLYESLASKLMAPFNSRMAINKLDGAILVTTTTDYEQTLEQFRDDYSSYERSMSQLLNADCRANPELFYEQIVSTRQLRIVVHSDVLELQRLAEQYKTNFTAFSETTRRNQNL